MKLEAKPTGSITDKTFEILSGAVTLIVVANKLKAKLDKKKLGDVALARHEAITIEKMLRQSAEMVENLMVVIEQRELPKLDKIGNRTLALSGPGSGSPSKKK